MQINFNKIKIHNFLSIGNAEIELDDKGIVSVIGINNNVSDKAKSNGSGKSSIFNAICWSLTGETTSGISTNVVNNHSNDGCYVELDFNVNKDNFRIIRSRESKQYGTNLKIYINNEDKSGKGIRESSALLENYLPDLTGEMIGSVIILGQGLPQRFSNNTPAGRKSVLEKLSKSDYMIEDIKSRIDDRKKKLDIELRRCEDNILKTETNIKGIENSYNNLVNKLNNLGDIDNFVNEIKGLEKIIDNLQEQRDNLQQIIDELDHKVEETNSNLFTLQDKLNGETTTLESEKNNNTKELNERKVDLLQLESVIKNKLKEIDSIKDICPTCHQKIIGVHKPDNTKLLEQKKELESELKEIDTNLKEFDNIFNEKKKQIDNNFKKQKETLLNLVQTLKSNLKEARSNFNKVNNNILDNTNKKNQLQTAVNNYYNLKEQYENEINENISQKEELSNKLVLYNREEKDTNNRLDIISKMSNIVKRDFRGILLQGVIDYINNKVKEYSIEAFDNDLIMFNLNGNNIDIIYDNKPYENLSGGEKQKVDILIQLALKEMLQQHLNIRTNILVLDEIFDNLDITGCQNIIKLINNKIKDVSSIFIISHHASELELSADNTLVVEKGKDGISKIIKV